MQGILLAIVAILLLAGFAYSCYRMIRDGHEGAWGAVAWNVVLLIAVSVGFWWIFPLAASEILYQGVWLNIFYIIPLAIAAILGLYALAKSGDSPALGVVYGLLALIVLGGGSVWLHSGTHLQTHLAYQFAAIDSLIPVSPSEVRFTPLQVAHRDMVQTISSSRYTVEDDLTDPVKIIGGVGYVSPIVPDGFVSTFKNKGDGFVVYNDAAGIDDDERVRRVEQTFKVGEEMQWRDNIYRHLYAADRTARYPEVHYLQLDPQNPGRFTAVAPKIEYRFKFPWYWIPVWGGVTLVHDNGKVEELTVAEATTDPRLKNRQIYPVSLARHLVEVQVYDDGFLGAFYNREGKIEVPDLPGDNQMPFYTVAQNGRQYYVVATEPAGQAYALFRVYYVDAATGDRFMYELDVSQGLLGPAKAIERVKSVQGFKWVEETSDGETGDFRVIEPVYITRGGKVYWKYTITTKSFTGVIRTVVVDAHSTASEQPLSFEGRDDFYRWLNGEDLPSHQQPRRTVSTAPRSAENVPTTGIESVRALLLEALARLDSLEQQQANQPN